MTDFSKYPETLGEIRSDRTSNASDWSPRDALISVLRLIDSGKESPDALVVAYRERLGPGETKTHFAVASPDVHTTLGLLESVKHELWGSRLP